MNINYSGIDEAELVLALYHGTRPLGLGMLHNNNSLSLEAVKEELAHKDASGYGASSGRYSFDYLYGRPIKVSLDVSKKEILRPDLYDRDAGDGSCQRIVDSLRATK